MVPYSFAGGQVTSSRSILDACKKFKLVGKDVPVEFPTSADMTIPYRGIVMSNKFLEYIMAMAPTTPIDDKLALRPALTWQAAITKAGTYPSWKADPTVDTEVDVSRSMLKKLFGKFHDSDDDM